MTPSGIEPATCRLVAQCLNRLRQSIPQETDKASDYFRTTEGLVKHHTRSTTFTGSKEKMQHNIRGVIDK